MNFLKQIFTWWNRQTIGTMILTIFSGKLKGIDEFGNKYYESKTGKRWVIYKDLIDSTNIPANWYSWIHFTDDKLPNQNQKRYFWEKKHLPNLTGTNKAYRPKKITENKIVKKKYNDFNISTDHLHQVIRDNNITRKRTKIRHYPDTRYGVKTNLKHELNVFFSKTNKLNLNKIISFDETSIHAIMIPSYSRCSLGKRCVQKT